MELIDTIKSEDYTFYLEVIKNVDNENNGYGYSKYLLNLSEEEVAKLTNAQLTLLKHMSFRNGHTQRFGIIVYEQKPIVKAMKKIPYNHIPPFDLEKLKKEDLIFFSKYYKNKWRKLHAKPRSISNDFKFNMDEFSLTVFKNNITKPFNSVEAKILIQRVNEAFNSSSYEDTPEIHIRNKFYAVILDNATTHTKAMTLLLKSTDLLTQHTVTYEPQEGEAICLTSVSVNTLATMLTRDSLETYSVDIPTCTHVRQFEGDRINERRITSASALMTAYTTTGNNYYKVLATKMLENTSQQMREKTLNKIENIIELQNVLKNI